MPKETREERKEKGKQLAREIITKTVLQLESEGKLTADWGPNLDDLATSTGLTVNEARGVWGRMVQEREGGNLGAADETVTLDEHDPPTGKDKRRAAGKAPVPPGDEEKTAVELPEEFGETDDGKRLFAIIMGTSGASKTKAQFAVKEYESDSDLYNHEQGALFSLLQNAGLADYRIKNIVTLFYRKRHSEGMAPRGESPVADDWMKSMLEMDQKLDYYERLQEIRARYRGGPRGEYGPQQRAGPNDFMQQAKELMLTKAIMRDDTGQAAPAGVVYEEEIEYTPLLDADNNEITDAQGTVQTKRVVHRRPVSLAAGTRTRSGAGGDGLDETMNQMMKFAMVKMMMQGMGGGNMMGSPYMGMESEPIMDAEGKPIVDKFGQVLMKTRSIPVPMLGQQQGNQLTAKDGIEMAVKMAEVMRPKNDDKTELTTVLMDRINQLSDTQMNIIREELEAVKGSDPMEYVLGTMAKFKELGYFGGEKGANDIDVAKMNFDFKKLELETKMGMQKWAHQERASLEDKKTAREQMKQLMNVFKETIHEVAAPIAKEVGTGLREGMGQARGRGGAPAVQAGAEGQQGRQKAASEMSDEELTQAMRKGAQAADVVAKAMSQIEEEAVKRGLLQPQTEGQGISR